MVGAEKLKTKKNAIHQASGCFDIKLELQEDVDAPAGRMIIHKTYNGALVGSAKGQMLSKRVEGGATTYSAVEEISATLTGKTGTFTLIHNGFMCQQERKLEVHVLPSSGTGQLTNISGTLEIIQEAANTSMRLNINYKIHYQLHHLTFFYRSFLCSIAQTVSSKNSFVQGVTKFRQNEVNVL